MFGKKAKVDVIDKDGNVIAKQPKVGRLGKIAIGVGLVALGKVVYDKGFGNGWTKGANDVKDALEAKEAPEEVENNEEESEDPE